MPRGSQARSGSNPRHLHQPPKPESITTTQPEPEPEQAPPHSRQQAASWTPPAAYTIDSQEEQPHTRAKAGAPAGHTAGHHLHKPSPQASAADSKNTRAGDTRPGGTCKDCKAEQHPAPAQAVVSRPASGKKKKPLPLKRRTDQTAEEHTARPPPHGTDQRRAAEENQRKEISRKNSKSKRIILRENLFLKRIEKITRK